MKIAVIIVRSLIGLLFTFGAVAYFFDLVPQPELSGAMKTFNEGVMASGYLMTLVKIVELICGILLLTGRFVPLALIMLFPVVVNILMVHVFLAPEGLPMAIVIFLATLFLAFSKRKHYKGLFAVN
jgi:uncharacterized membrane protein YphA (DoxX/SURF4 family)